MQKYKKHKKQYEKDQENIKSFDRLYRKSLQDNLIDKNEHGSSCNTFTRDVDETTNEPFFMNMNINKNLNFFSNIILNFHART